MKSEQCDTRNPSGKLTFRFWFYLGLAATLLVWSSPADAEEVTVTDSDGSLWTLQINPGASRANTFEEFVPPSPDAVDVETELASVDATVLAPVAVTATQDAGITIRPLSNELFVNNLSYTEIYRAIPYSKTEYYANPSYRHDATMEILFGELRPGGGNSGRTGRVIENPIPGRYRPYLFTDWARPRPYYPPFWSGFTWPGYGHGMGGGGIAGPGGSVIGGPAGGPGGIGSGP